MSLKSKIIAGVGVLALAATVGCGDKSKEAEVDPIQMQRTHYNGTVDMKNTTLFEEGDVRIESTVGVVNPETGDNFPHVQRKRYFYRGDLKAETVDVDPARGVTMIGDHEHDSFSRKRSGTKVADVYRSEEVVLAEGYHFNSEDRSSLAIGVMDEAENQLWIATRLARDADKLIYARLSGDHDWGEIYTRVEDFLAGEYAGPVAEAKAKKLEDALRSVTMRPGRRWM